MNISEANAPAAKGMQIIISKKGLKQVCVAEKSGIGQQALSDMLNGRKIIRACDIYKIARTLGVTIDEIYEAGREDVRDSDA